jgi:uncharacterized protein YecE (DUF72 family)
MTSNTNEVRYGTAGWVFEDWYGTFYPAPPREEGPGALFSGVPAQAPDPDVGLAKREPLRYYARYFDLVEVNSSFYGIPTPRTTSRWVALTERREGPPFLFSFKLPRAFSHEGDLVPAEVQAFHGCLEPVAAAGRLAAVLAQFPHRFSWSSAAAERLERIRAAFPDLPLVAEVRHRSWEEAPALDLLRGLNLTLASVDQPLDDSTLPPQADALSGDLAYVRLHGRNARAWFDPRAGRDARYDYLYSPSEVREWGARIERLAGVARRTLVIANNHYRGQAPANALELRGLREGRAVVPRALGQVYPRLAGLGEGRGA